MKNLDELTKKLKDTFVTEVICGGNFNGSVVILTFNNRFSLTIQCVWRLTDQSNILASWNEADNSVGSHFEINVTALRGDFLSEINVNNFFDLQLIFDSGKNLNVFCDINSFFDEEYFDENWYLSDKEENISLGIGRENNIIQSTYS